MNPKPFTGHVVSGGPVTISDMKKTGIIKESKFFECPYTKYSCTHLDTSGMTKTKECMNCENYKPTKP